MRGWETRERNDDGPAAAALRVHGEGTAVRRACPSCSRWQRFPRCPRRASRRGMHASYRGLYLEPRRRRRQQASASFCVAAAAVLMPSGRRQWMLGVEGLIITMSRPKRLHGCFPRAPLCDHRGLLVPVPVLPLVPLREAVVLPLLLPQWSPARPLRSRPSPWRSRSKRTRSKPRRLLSVRTTATTREHRLAVTRA